MKINRRGLGFQLTAAYFLYDRLYNFYTEKMMYFYMTKSTKSQKEEGNSCLGDAVQRWLRHPEPSSWSCKSTRKEKYLYVSFSLLRKQNYFQQIEYAQACFASFLQFYHKAKMLACKSIFAKPSI